MQRRWSPAAPARAEAVGDGGLTAPEVLAFVERAAAALVRHEALLDRLDAALGDGDHGENMLSGFQSVTRVIGEERPSDVGELLRRVGHTLVSSVGGASGPLYGTAFIEAGIYLARARFWRDLSDLAGAFLGRPAAGLARRGRCAVGDKTIYDALEPAAAAVARAAAG